MAHILIVDDEPRIRSLIQDHLHYADFTCEMANDGVEALALLSTQTFDLVLLDVMMPNMDGFTCLYEMREQGMSTPVIMLTARGEEYDKLAGLEGGADDYMVKPFSPRELIARVRAVLHRSAPKQHISANSMAFGALQIDLTSRNIIVDGKARDLTPKEFDLLVLLANSPNTVFKRLHILEQVWDLNYYGDDRTVDTHIKMLRTDLAPYRDCIATVWGIGYKFDPSVLL